ncbi:MAG: RNA-binding S4 domain-containing protein [Planctomycetaceae bacterium]|nr:RNA-binding S4 domain-containing protein [Planctomycetaceae bacterium]
MSEEQPIRLDQFLKLRGLVGSGGQAKRMIQAGEVLVNGEIVTRRRRKMAPGDIVSFEGCNYGFEESDADT